MWFGIVTLFPEVFTVLNIGITGRAIKNNLISINTWNPRDFSTDKHQSVDDAPYGGGPGMVMAAPPLIKSIQAARSKASYPPSVIYLSPQGKIFNQTVAIEASSKKAFIFLCGRYEGIDERVLNYVDEEWSIGDFILTGGELVAMSMIDAITRLIPGALGDDESAKQDSLYSGLLKYPQYTRPEEVLGETVPSILLSGHHQKITDWRLKASLGRTWLKRPDLLQHKTLNDHEKSLLNEFIQEYNYKK